MEIEAGKSIYVPEVLVYNEVYKLNLTIPQERRG